MTKEELAHEEAVWQEMGRERARRDARRRLDAEERGPEPNLVFETLMRRLERPVDPVQYRINGWLPRDGRAMFSAPAKGGKTRLVGNLIRSMADGDPFLGRDRVVPVMGPVLLLDFEMSSGQLDHWLRDQRIRTPQNVLVSSLRGQASAFDILRPEIRARLAAPLRLRRVEVVILDCLRPVLDALGLDEQKDGGRFLVAFDAFMAEAGIREAVVVHHMGHAGERSRGDSRFRDWPDVEWRLVRQDDDPASPRFLAAFGRDVDQPEQRLNYDPQTRRLSLAGGSRKDAKAEAALDAVREVLAVTGPLSGRALKAKLAESDHARNAIDEALKLGALIGALHQADGPKKSKLYSLVSQVSRSVPTDSRDTASMCPAAYIGRDTGTLVSGHSPAETNPDTGSEPPEVPTDGCF